MTQTQHAFGDARAFDDDRVQTGKQQSLSHRNQNVHPLAMIAGKQEARAHRHSACVHTCASDLIRAPLCGGCCCCRRRRCVSCSCSCLTARANVCVNISAVRTRSRNTHTHNTTRTQRAQKRVCAIATNATKPQHTTRHCARYLCVYVCVCAGASPIQRVATTTTP